MVTEANFRKPKIEVIENKGLMERKAIEDIKNQEEHRNLMSVACFQARFIKRWSERLSYSERDEFNMEVGYLIHLIYRESQQPLIKQMTDFIVNYSQPRIERLK